MRSFRLGHTLVDDVIIVGAGIIGCACAAALAKQGLRVKVIESGIVGGGATAAGMGHLVVMDDNPAELALTSYSLDLWRDLVAHSPVTHEYHRCGTLWVASDEAEMAAAQAKQQQMHAHGISCTMLATAALQKAEPSLRQGLAGGLLVADDGLVYPPKSAKILLDQAIQYGAQFLNGEVDMLIPGGARLVDGREILAQEVVIANGLAGMKLMPELPLRFKKGHVLITDRYPGFAHHHLVELGYIKSAHSSDGESVAFNLQPRPTGQIMLGSSRQFDVTDKAVEPAILAKMLKKAINFIPALADLKAIRSWTGFRAASPDGLPMIGSHPWRKNVWIASGHEGLGITTSLATAEILKDQMTKQASKIATAPYLPSRFHFDGESST